MIQGLRAALLVGLLLQDGGANSYLGKTPPELVSRKDQWLNAPEAITLEKLRGKVVWLEFGFLKCAPCKKMKPNLSRWHQDFTEKGLVVIDIDDGSYDDFAEVKKEVEAKGEKFATLWDKEAKNCLAYGIQGYPQAWLIGVDGKVVWEGIPNAKIPEIEKAMAAEFGKVKK
jgi:thiol-disulfide isomerase/thioredoxin